MPPRTPLLARLQSSVRLNGNQSALFRWFLQNHKEFEAALAKVSRPTWQSITEEFGAEGLRLKDGGPLTVQYVRHRG